MMKRLLFFVGLLISLSAVGQQTPTLPATGTNTPIQTYINTNGRTYSGTGSRGFRVMAMQSSVDSLYAAINSNLSGKVDKTTTVNGHALSGNVNVTFADVLASGNTANSNFILTNTSNDNKLTSNSNSGGGWILNVTDVGNTTGKPLMLSPTSSSRVLIGTTTDNGVDKLQVNGSIIGANLLGNNTGDNATNTTSNAYADGKVQNSLTPSTSVAPSATAVNNAFPLKDGTGATGTWGVNITGNAATATTVPWTGVTSRPTALSQFTNDLTGYVTTTGTQTVGGAKTFSSNITMSADRQINLSTSSGASSQVSPLYTTWNNGSGVLGSVQAGRIELATNDYVSILSAYSGRVEITRKSNSAIYSLGMPVSGLGTSLLFPEGRNNETISTTADLSAYAPLASPTFTGTVEAPKIVADTLSFTSTRPLYFGAVAGGSTSPGAAKNFRIIQGTAGGASGNVQFQAQNSGVWNNVLRLITNGITTDNLYASTFNLSGGLNTAPASSTATGAVGEIRITADYIYVCIVANTWVRSPLTTW